MNRRTFVRLLPLGLLPALPTRSAMAEDWPNWRGPRFDNVSAEKGLLRAFPPEGPRLLWERPIPGGWSQPSISQGRLFIQTEDQKREMVLCLDPRSGEKRWEHLYDCDYDQHPTLDQRFKSGPRATPTVEGDRVYTLGTTGTLLCLAAADGKVIWRKELLELAEGRAPDMGYTGSPVVHGDLLFVHPGGRQGSSLAAFNKRDGALMWKQESDVVGCSTPILVPYKGKLQLVHFTGQGLVAVRPEDGGVLWRYEWKTAFDLNVATPIHRDGQIFISSNYGKGAAMVRIQEGPAPQEVYTTRAMANWFTGSILLGDHLYGFNDNRLTCLEWATGARVWDQAGFGRGGITLADGMLIVLSERGELALVEASPAGFKELSRWKSPLRPPCWTSPVLANGILYIRNQEQMLALAMRA